MGLGPTRKIWSEARAKGTDLLVLLAIGDFANAEGEAWPLSRTLAAKTRMSERQVRRHVARLVAMGDLRVVFSRGERRASLYRIACGEEAARATGVGSDRTAGARGGSIEAAAGDIQGRPNKEYERPSNRQIEPEGEDSDPPQDEVPAELAALDAALRGCRGYRPDARFYRKLLENYSDLDLEEQAIRMASWLGEPGKRGRLCTPGFVLGWLRREVERTDGGRGDAGTRGHGEGVRSGRKRELGGSSGLERFG